jgi:hypothetical protein
VRWKNQQQGGYGRGNPYDQRIVSEGTAFCNWVGDSCVVSGCNFAFCERRALLPDGSCGLDEREASKQVKSIEEDSRKEELLVRSARDKLVKKKGTSFDDF